MSKKNLKIILAGLDNAGKTSMLVGLRKMYGFESEVHGLKPTIRVDYYRREFLNLQLNFFDMGGQQKFRNSYLKRPIYFESVNQLIYLIDIQDELRFDESVEYLGKILDILDKLEYAKDHPIYICFSKADYDFVEENISEYASRVKMIKDLVAKTYPSFTFEFYSTSIYNVYTIVRMISNGIRRYLDSYSHLRDTVESFGNKNEVKQLLVFDNTGLVISDYFKGEGEGLELQNKIDQIISSHLEFFKQLEDQNLDVTSSRGVDGEFMNLCYQFQLYRGFNEDLTEEMKTMIAEEPDNPLVFNYYVSMISPLGVTADIESEIPSLVGTLREDMKEMIDGN